MGQSKLRKAIGAVKDKTSIGLAKVGSNNSKADLEVAIVKATMHEEYPAQEKHIKEILSLTCYSGASVSASVSTLSKRLNKTTNWIVALKTLILIQRLLSQGDPAYQHQIFHATRRGTHLLNMSDFRDSSRSSYSWDFSAFVRTYALYLDERLHFRILQQTRSSTTDRHEEEKALVVRQTPVSEMKIEQLLTRAQHLQQMIHRFLACRPTGASKNNRVVIVALNPIVKESFQIYHDMTEVMSLLLDKFMELQVRECVKVYEIFFRVSKQFEELDRYYLWCKSNGIARTSEYPEVEKISKKKLEIMDDFIGDTSALTYKRSPPKITGELNTDDDEDNAKPESDVAEDEVDMDTVKALPPPEEDVTTKEDDLEIIEESINRKDADFINLGDDDALPNSQDHADHNMALALFNASPAPAPGWVAFDVNNHDSGDWEAELVASTSKLSNQKASFGGGFDTLLLDSMYQQGAPPRRVEHTGSASSVVTNSSGMTTLALLPPVTSSNGGSGGIDPFAASLGVAAPPYVQMWEMEKKQQLLVEEQLMWQKYAGSSDHGMQGQYTNLNSNNPYNYNYNMGPCTH